MPRAQLIGGAREPKLAHARALPSKACDTLLVVSILDIVYDCHLRQLLQS